jgi:hypothetical protein
MENTSCPDTRSPACQQITCGLRQAFMETSTVHQWA